MTALRASPPPQAADWLTVIRFRPADFAARSARSARSTSAITVSVRKGTAPFSLIASPMDTVTRKAPPSGRATG